MRDFPCKECFRRTPTCHSTCEEYLEAKRKSEEIRRINLEESSLNGFCKKRTQRIEQHKPMKIYKSPKK